MSSVGSGELGGVGSVEELDPVGRLGGGNRKRQLLVLGGWKESLFSMEIHPQTLFQQVWRCYVLTEKLVMMALKILRD